VERLLLVGLGAFLGGICRYWLSGWVGERLDTAFPYGTLLVNVSGSFLLAFLIVYTTDRLGLGPEVRLFLGTGFCGGYTTFSTFAYEALLLTDARSLPTALLYVLASVVLSVLAAIAGLWLARLA